MMRLTMKKRVSWIVMIILVLVFAYWYAHIAKMNMIYDKGVDNSEYISMGILEDQRVEQKFVCREDTMDGIYVKCHGCECLLQDHKRIAQYACCKRKLSGQ